MIRRWFRHFAWGALATYLVILIVAFFQPQDMELLFGQFGLGQIGSITCLVIGAAWASSYTIWKYARGRDVR